MKLLTSFALILSSSLLFAQADTTRVQKVQTKNSLIQKQQAIKMERVQKYNTNLSVYGNYKVLKYYVLKTKTPSKETLEKIIGSTVIIENDQFSGSVIERDSIAIYETEQMTRSDYIYRVFGREIRAPEPDIPTNLNVYKTGNLECYGIVLMSDGNVALPYKGVLLILEPVK